MADNKNKKGFVWNLINTIIGLSGLCLALYINYQQQALNKQHINPSLTLMVFNSTNGTSKMQIRNISILPAVEIYVRRKIYYCSRDGKEVYATEEEKPGWYIKELFPTEIKTEVINKEYKDYIARNCNLYTNTFEAQEKIEPVEEFKVEFHRQSDLKKYNFKQMYFLKDDKLIWSEEARVKNDPYYSGLFKLVSTYKRNRRLPNIEELGRY